MRAASHVKATSEELTTPRTAPDSQQHADDHKPSSDDRALTYCCRRVSTDNDGEENENPHAAGHERSQASTLIAPAKGIELTE